MGIFSKISHVVHQATSTVNQAASSANNSISQAASTANQAASSANNSISQAASTANQAASTASNVVNTSVGAINNAILTAPIVGITGNNNLNLNSIINSIGNSGIGGLSRTISNNVKQAPDVINSSVKDTTNKIDTATTTINNVVASTFNSNQFKNFDWKAYLQKYPDLEAAGLITRDQAIAHYQSYGKNEGRIYTTITNNVGSTINSVSNVGSTINSSVGTIIDKSSDVIDKSKDVVNLVIDKSSDVIDKSKEAIDKIKDYSNLVGDFFKGPGSSPQDNQTNGQSINDSNAYVYILTGTIIIGFLIMK